MLQSIHALDLCRKRRYNLTMDRRLEGKKLNYQRHKNGSTYVYEVLERYWDKEKKQARVKQVYLGKLDPETGDFVPSKRFGEDRLAATDNAVTATTRISGPAMLLNQVDKEIGLSSILKKAAPEIWREILALAWYLLVSGRGLSDADLWLAQHDSPTDRVLSSQRISDLLRLITEDVRQTFFKLWGGQLVCGDHLCYDITSVSSYAKQNEYVRYGYNRDREPLPQINLAMVYGQKCFLPVSYRELPGSISDVKTLDNLLEQFNKLDFPKLHFVMDKGFYSQWNLDSLCAQRHHFTIALPIHLRCVRELIDEYRDEIDGPDGLREVNGEAIYLKSVLYSWGESRRRAYLHIYFNPQLMTDDRVDFDRRILQLERELFEGQWIEAHAEQYKQFFTVKETPKRGRKVLRNAEAITAARKRYVGFNAILTTKFKDPLEALRVYREKDVIEKSFDDLKNELDMKRLRVHDSKRMKGRTFIQFLALILLAQIRNIMRQSRLSEKYTAKRLLWELESLTTISYRGKYKNRLSEMTRAQREIFDAFRVVIE